MSLINKMLRDLESRQTSRSEVSRHSVYEDLRPARGRTGTPPVRVAIAGLAVAVLAVAGVYGWLKWNGSTPTPPAPLPGPVAAVAPAVATPVPAETPLPAAVPVPPPPAPSVAKSVETKPRVTTPEASKPTPAVKPPPAPVAKAAPPAKPVTTVAAQKNDDAGKMEKTVKPLAPGEQAEGHFREAAALVNQGRALEAEPKLRAALAADPAHAPARELLVGIQLQQGRVPAARELLEQGIEKNPKHTAFTRLLARLHVDGGSDAQAIALLEKHAPAAGNDAEYQGLLATLYQRAGRHSEAIQRYTQALALRPQEGRWWMGMGLSCEAEKKTDAAAEAYQRALSAALDPKLQQYVRGRLAAVKK